MNNVLDISQHRFASTDRLFLDANFLLYVFGPQGRPGERRSREYSRAFFDMKRAGSALHIDVLVLSEFINRYARLRHRNYEDKGGTLAFKQWRDDTGFEADAKAISIACRLFMKDVKPVDSGFDTVDVGLLLREFGSGGHDFNDQMFARKCMVDGLTLVTHDADFGKYDIPILTANRTLLV